MYQRRITHVLGSRSSAGGQRIAVNFAIAGQLEEFRQVGGRAGGWCSRVVWRLAALACPRAHGGPGVPPLPGSRVPCKLLAECWMLTPLLDALLQVEEFSEKPIEEMPVHVSDIFAS